MKLIYDEVVGGKTGVIIGHSMGGALAVHLSYLVGNSGLVGVFTVLFEKSTVGFMHSVTGLKLSSLLPFSVDLRWPTGILIRAADDFFSEFLNPRS